MPSSTTWYYAAGGSSVINRPPNAGAAFGLMVMRNASGNRFQIYINSSAGAIYSRNFYSNAWTAWTQWPVNFATAGYRNSIYRGINLGSAVTAEQYAAISAGTFENMFVGDYWTINNINWRIAGFDYWYKTGDVTCNSHHVVIVPDSNLANAKMNETSMTEGAYVGSDYYTGNNGNTAKATVNSIIESAFGTDHLLNHKIRLSNAVTDGYESAGAWYESTFDLMSEKMVYGCEAYRNYLCAGGESIEYTVDKCQLPLFRYDQMRMIASAYWLRDVSTSTMFCSVTSGGGSYRYGASTSSGIRPAFGIKG